MRRPNGPPNLVRTSITCIVCGRGFITKGGLTTHNLRVHNPQRTIPASAYAATETEEQFLQRVRQLATLRGWKSYHTRRSERSDPGFPDLTLCRGNRLLFLELKREGGKVSLAQQDWIEAINAVAGHVEARVLYPSDWTTLEALLQ